MSSPSSGQANVSVGFFHTLLYYDPHTEKHSTPTVPQLAMLWIWIVCFFTFLVRITRNKHKTTRTEARLQQNSGTVAQEAGQGAGGEVRVAVAEGGKVVATPAAAGQISGGDEGKRFSAIKPPPELNEFLMYVIQLGVIMLFFYYSDYVKVFPRTDRVYSRDTFLFVVFLLFLVGTVYTTRPCTDKILNRDITEEWKGWMQVMFVWYHYFAAAEWYNWIRIYIAAYVWMTGFGNFSFFWIKKDYSIWRASKMLFRLNFLVLVICAAVANPFMLYYICPMHTYWFLSVYAFMAIFSSWNEHRGKILIKFAVYALFNFIIFDIPGVCEVVFKPLWPLLGFHYGQTTIMHEWSFRLGLDHWVCFIGMVCAYNYPYFEAFMQKLEKRYAINTERWKEIAIKVGISVAMLVIYCLWHQCILSPMDKFAYNKVHPYTSFIPIMAFIWFRNVFPVLRSHYIHLFAELGKITLETYLSQLHAYLQSNAKELINYIDGYPLLNFSFNTIIYLGISHTLFTVTSDMSSYLLPKEMKLFRWRLSCGAICLLVALALGALSSSYLWVLVPYV